MVRVQVPSTARIVGISIVQDAGYLLLQLTYLFAVGDPNPHPTVSTPDPESLAVKAQVTDPP